MLTEKEFDVLQDYCKDESGETDQERLNSLLISNDENILRALVRTICAKSGFINYSSEVTRKKSREEEYLISFADDFKRFLKSGEWFVNNLAKAREVSKSYWDFICAFDDLKEKMKEFSWNSDFLLQNGIDFKEIRKLYFAVA